MIDQKDKFIKKGIRAEFFGQAQDDEAAIAAVIKGDIQLVYISPENLLCNMAFRKMSLSDKYKNYLRALVVDEPHCQTMVSNSAHAIYFIIYIALYINVGETIFVERFLKYGASAIYCPNLLR